MVRARKWWLVDAHGHTVGRLASQLPKLLQVSLQLKSLFDLLFLLGKIQAFLDSFS